MSDLFASLDKQQQRTRYDHWDDEHGKAIPTSQWQHAREFIAFVQEALPLLPVPSVDPCGDGFIHVCWHTPKGDRALFEVGSKECWWSLLSVDRSKPAEVVHIDSFEDAVDRLRVYFAEEIEPKDVLAELAEEAQRRGLGYEP